MDVSETDFAMQMSEVLKERPQMFPLQPPIDIEWHGDTSTADRGLAAWSCAVVHFRAAGGLAGKHDVTCFCRRSWGIEIPRMELEIKSIWQEENNHDYNHDLCCGCPGPGFILEFRTAMSRNHQDERLGQYRLVGRIMRLLTCAYKILRVVTQSCTVRSHSNSHFSMCGSNSLFLGGLRFIRWTKTKAASSIQDKESSLQMWTQLPVSS